MKKQQPLFIILGIVAIFLGYEFLFREYPGSSSKGKKQDTTDIQKDTAKADKNLTKKKGIFDMDESVEKDTILSTEDSIAQTYANTTYLKQELKFPRVREAYKTKKEIINQYYEDKKIDQESVQIYIRVFKKEKELEIWAKDKQKEQFILLKKYPICDISGNLGPKRKLNDNQIPEGFYHIDRFNPNSTYLLSLGLNFPNKSDKYSIDSTEKLKSEIFIYGGCKTKGSIPMSDDKIKEIYVMAVDAKAAGQKKIAVSIFPTKLNNENFNFLKEEHADKPELVKFWKQLKEGYNAFEKCKKLPDIMIDNKGNYKIKPACK
ncbi:MAG: hypothetical protein EAZ20_10700 [Bacteroidetes bacterium]|nr:MAG: hypothetical protein EAZ20_10700 [Bacteroidota bacterium]